MGVPNCVSFAQYHLDAWGSDHKGYMDHFLLSEYRLLYAYQCLEIQLVRLFGIFQYIYLSIQHKHQR